MGAMNAFGPLAKLAAAMIGKQPEEKRRPAQGSSASSCRRRVHREWCESIASSLARPRRTEA